MMLHRDLAETAHGREVAFMLILVLRIESKTNHLDCELQQNEDASSVLALIVLMAVISQVSFANETLWIGYTKYKQDSEPFCPVTGSQLSFTSWHQTPTGWQNPYIFSNKTAPVQFTTAHGHYVPEGASSVGFGFDGDGKWTFEGQNKFVACQTKDMVKQGPESGYQI
ncbi:hypothetical protein BKA64DRAFT_775870 [Cadophora sp. MPI-SDFR-AT-0126]|nr:hypothetical protein BKA64DRAFT_775870 [Leotiomycetes sp. MPI-SDFR-AT-0126]